MGVFVGLLGLIPLWKVLEPPISMLGSGLSGVPERNTQLLWMVFFLVAVLITGLSVGLRRIAKSQVRKPLIFGWAVSGAGRRITFEKIRADRCPKCGGKMKYLNKATKWIDHRDANGRTRREVTERVPALECKRNAKHWYEVDPAEDEES